MALRDRVLILPDGTCRVSMPGFDVKTAKIDEMSFDDRFAAIGQAIWSNTTVPRRNAGATNPGKRTVQFGRTFSTPPMFLFGWKTSNNDPNLQPPRVNPFSTSNFNRISGVEARVGVSSVEFRNWYSDSGIDVTVYWKALI